MTKAQALKLAVSKWGKRAAVEDGGVRFRDGTPRPTPAEREAMRAELATLRANKPVRADIATFGDDRTVGELRAAWREYQVAYDAWKKRTDHLMGCCYARRYTIGELSTFAFHVRGKGDTWEEAFEDASKP